MQKIASMLAEADVDRMEVIHKYALAPWSDRIQVVGEPDQVEVVTPNEVEGIISTNYIELTKGVVRWEAWRTTPVPPGQGMQCYLLWVAGEG